MGKRGIKKDVAAAPAASVEKAAPKEAAKPGRKPKGKGEKASNAPPAMPEISDLSWDSLPDVMENYDLREDEAIEALTELLGPKPCGKAWFLKIDWYLSSFR